MSKDVRETRKIVICCGSKNSSKLLFSRFTYVDSCYGDEMRVKVRDFTRLIHSRLTTLPRRVRFFAFFFSFSPSYLARNLGVQLQDYVAIPIKGFLIFYQCQCNLLLFYNFKFCILSPSKFLLSTLLCIREGSGFFQKGFFLTAAGTSLKCHPSSLPYPPEEG